MGAVMTELDKRLIAIWREQGSKPVCFALALRTEAIGCLHLKWSTLARIGHPDEDSDALAKWAAEYDRDFHALMLNAIRALRDYREARRHAA